MIEVSVQCPACFQWVGIEIDRQDRGLLVQDCEVCCRPMEVRVQWRESGEPEVRVEPAG